MNFLRLHDSRLSVLFEDEDIIAIDKPYGFNAHTNDSKIEHSNQIRDGLIEIYEKQRGAKLHIIHRLDQTTTGVMIFGKSTESAKKYAEFFFNRQVKKTYYFVTKSISKKSSFYIDQVIVHKGKELDADTDLMLLKKAHGFELWQANPHTGRNHQIRIHAKAAGISILGDEKYEGATFPFLCLHNHKIEFPNGVTISSRVPQHFQQMEILLDYHLSKLFFEVDRRQRLYSMANFLIEPLRLAYVRNPHHDLDYSLDLIGNRLILNWYKDNWSDIENRRFDKLADWMELPLMLHFPLRKKEKNPNGLLKSEAWQVTENKVHFAVRSESGHYFGLNTNQRLQRGWVKQNCQGKKVLVLFSGSSSFAIPAALGGAAQVISVEASKSAINTAKENLGLNSIEPTAIQFLCRDSLSFLEQCRNRNQKFDLIICDAPSFFRREKGFFKIENDLLKLLKVCIEILETGGELLFSTSSEALFIDDIRRILNNLNQKLQINCILPSLDFELEDEKVMLKSFLIQRLD